METNYEHPQAPKRVFDKLPDDVKERFERLGVKVRSANYCTRAELEAVLNYLEIK